MTGSMSALMVAVWAGLDGGAGSALRVAVLVVAVALIALAAVQIRAARRSG